MFKRIHRHDAEMRENVAHMPVSPLSQIQHLTIVPFASLDEPQCYNVGVKSEQ